jgi:hypothetical protein
MPYAERQSNILNTEESLAAVEVLLAERWMNDYGVKIPWRVEPILVMNDETPVGITVSCDWGEIERVHLDPRYSWLLVMEGLATTAYPHFLMDVQVSALDPDDKFYHRIPLTLTEDELTKLDDQIRVKNSLEEALREFSAGGWFSIAVKQTPKPTLVVFYDEAHAKYQGYNQRKMRTLVREVLEETTIAHDFSGVIFLHSYLRQPFEERTDVVR